MAPIRTIRYCHPVAVDEEPVWEVVAGVLALASALAVTGAVLQAFGFGPSGSIQYRLEVAAQSANILDALLALLAVALMHVLGAEAKSRTRLRRWIVCLAVGTALMVTVGAAYSIWDVLTVSIGHGGIPIGGSGWAGRLAVVSTRLAALSIAGVTVVLGTHPGSLRSRPTRPRIPLKRSEWPDPWEDEASLDPGE